MATKALGKDTTYKKHADLSITEIYTHVSIEQLQEIHRAAHSAKLDKEVKGE